MPNREARSVAESSEGPTASKSDRAGRKPGMTRLVRRSSATSGGTAFLSLAQTFRQRMRKCSGSLIFIAHRYLLYQKRFWFLQGIDISVDCTGINVDVGTVRVWPGDRGERWFRADWEA